MREGNYTGENRARFDTGGAGQAGWEFNRRRLILSGQWSETLFTLGVGVAAGILVAGVFA